jgi:hypothetical protein
LSLSRLSDFVGRTFNFNKQPRATKDGAKATSDR